MTSYIYDQAGHLWRVTPNRLHGRSTITYRSGNTNGEIPLAQKIQTLFVDDIDGGEAEGTVRFGLDGVGYEIDLSVAHTEDLHKAWRRTLRTPGRSAAPGGRPAAAVAMAVP